MTHRKSHKDSLLLKYDMGKRSEHFFRCAFSLWSPLKAPRELKWQNHSRLLYSFVLAMTEKEIFMLVALPQWLLKVILMLVAISHWLELWCLFSNSVYVLFCPFTMTVKVILMLTTEEGWSVIFGMQPKPLMVKNISGWGKLHFHHGKLFLI